MCVDQVVDDMIETYDNNLDAFVVSTIDTRNKLDVILTS